MSNKQKLSDVQNATPGGKCTIQIPAGPTYDSIILELLGASAQLGRITNIRFSLNGKPVREYASGTELDFVNQFYGYDAAALPGRLVFPFSRIEVQAAGDRSTVDAERLTALRTGNAGPMTLSFDIDPAYVDASAANIKAFAMIAPGAPQPMGLMTFTRRGTYNLVAGSNVVNDTPKVARVLAHHILRNDITEVTVKRRLKNREKETLWDEVLKTALQEDQNQHGRVPNAARTVIDFCDTGNLDESVALVDEEGNPAAEYDLKITSTAGGSTDILTEYLGNPADF